MSLPEERAQKRTIRALDALNLWTSHRIEGFPGASLRWRDREAEKTHREWERYFAYVPDNGKVEIRVAGSIGRLPDRFLYGVMAHEFGHLIAMKFWEDQTEEGADEAARDMLDLHIEYETPYAIQTITCQDVHALKGLLDEEFRP